MSTRLATGSAERASARSSMDRPPSVEAKAARGEGEERPPEKPVEQSDEYRHHGNAEHDAGVVAGLGRLRNVGSQTVGCQLGIAPTRRLGDDAGVPATAAGGDGAGDIVRKHAGQNDLSPPGPSAHAETRGRLRQVARKGARSGDD